MEIEEIRALVRPNIQKLCPYSTARDEYEGSIGIFLDANESPYPTGWNRYPDPRQKALKEKISRIKGVPEGNIFLGNGSDEAIDLIFRVFCIPGKDNVVAMSPSYGMYAVAADINDVRVRSARLAEDFSLSVQEILDKCDSDTKAVFLCSPNNPSGNIIPKEVLAEIQKSFKGIVVLDEAYIDFSSGPGMLPELEKYPNLVILQTFSKAWGMASLRLGLAFAHPFIIELMSMVKYPYNINGATQSIALEALEKPVTERAAEIVSQRERLSKALGAFSFVEKVYPSEANFLLVKVSDADDLYNHLISKGIIVRNRNRVEGCAGCLRISVGLAEENDSLLRAMEEYEKSNIR